MAKVGDLRDLLRRKWYVDGRLHVLVQEKKTLSVGLDDADKRAFATRRAYVTTRRVALLSEVESFRAESKQIKAELKGVTGA